MLSRDDISGNLFLFFFLVFFRSFYTQVWWKSTKWVAQHFQRESNSLMNSEGGGGGGLFFVKQPKPERCHITGAGCSCVKCTQSSRLVEYVAQQQSKRKPHVWWRSPSFFLTSLYTNTPLRLFMFSFRLIDIQSRAHLKFFSRFSCSCFGIETSESILVLK